MSGAIPITGPKTDRARIAPVPDWVVHEPYDAPIRPEEVFVSGGRCTLLDDTQVNLVDGERAWHSRSAERIITNAGAERAAQFLVPFDPTCETLEVHFVRVIRDGTVIDHTRPDEFEVFRRERSLERLVFDGRLSVNLVIPDVRPGDIIESSYTITGGNPVLRGKHSAWIAFEWGQSVLETRHRVRTPTDRPIRFRAVNDAPAPDITEQDGVRDMRWRAVRRPAIEFEDLTPPWDVIRAEVQFSEYETWAEVADLFTPLYDTDQPLPADLDAAIAELATRHEKPADRAAEALRFVQGHLRYLALSIGEGGLQPRTIEAAWASRYGDCKDAARLYVAMARRLGLDACPALVNTRQGENLDQWLPTASAFDHCIVRLVVDNRTWWIDPTRPVQAGRLERMSHSYHGFALPLFVGADRLESMGPLAPEYMIDVRERATFGPKPNSPATYEWRTTYYSWRADDIRERIANEGVTAVARGYLRQLQDTWPGVQAAEPMHIEDDPTENRLTTVERYEIPTPWKRVDGNRVEFRTRDFFIGADLADLAPQTQRRRDVHLGRPRITTRRVELELPMDWPRQAWDTVTDGHGLRFETKLRREKKRVYVLEQRLEVLKDTLPAAQAGDYVNVVGALRRGADIVIDATVRGDRFASAARVGWRTLVRFGLIAGAIGFMAWGRFDPVFVAWGAVIAAVGSYFRD